MLGYLHFYPARHLLRDCMNYFIFLITRSGVSFDKIMSDFGAKGVYDGTRNALVYGLSLDLADVD